MNKIKIGVAALAIILTASVSYATQKNTTSSPCYLPDSSTPSNTDNCPEPQTKICCYEGEFSTGQVYFQRNT